MTTTAMIPEAVHAHETVMWSRTAEGGFMKLELYCGGCGWRSNRHCWDWSADWDRWGNELLDEHQVHLHQVLERET